MDVETDYLLIGESGTQTSTPVMKGKHLEQLQELLNGNIEGIDQNIFPTRFNLYTKRGREIEANALQRIR